MKKNNRFIFYILFICFLFLSINVYALPKGDIDGNGKVASMDYILVRKHLLKQALLTGDKLTRADVNGDGKVSFLDYTLIRNTIWENANSQTPTPQPTNTPTPTVVPTEQYTVTFDSSGGDQVASQKINKDGKVQVPSTPKRNGYTFIEWQLNGKKYDFNSKVTSNIKLVAIWIKLDKTSYTLKTNDKDSIKYTIDPKSSDIKVAYTSQNNSIVTVDASGNIRAIGAGNTNIIVNANNVNVGTVETIVDYGFFDTCSSDKKNTKVSVKTNKDNSVNIYSCLENQDWTHQSVAVTSDSIIYSKPTYRAWCQSGSKYSVPKYNLSGECESKGYGVLVVTSSNSFNKYNRKTGKVVVNHLDLAGHGQAFDATGSNEIYVNYFPILIDSKHGYGAHATGVAYIKGFSSDQLYIDPNSKILVKSNGNISLYNSSYTIGTTEYNKDIISKAKEKDNMKSLELAVDEDHNRIAIMDKNTTSNDNFTLYLYKLSDFIKGKKNLIDKYYFPSSVCSGSTCGHQGIELYGNYLYSVNSMSITKFKYSTCSKTDKKGATCTTIENVKIPDTKIGKEYGKDTTGINELEGMSVYKGKVYVSVLTNKFSDGKRKNILLYLEGF